MQSGRPFWLIGWRAKTAGRHTYTRAPICELAGDLGSREGARVTSKALIYDELVRYASVADRCALAALLKGGLIVAERVDGPIDGAPASRVGGQGPWHYVSRTVSLLTPTPNDKSYSPR